MRFLLALLLLTAAFAGCTDDSDADDHGDDCDHLEGAEHDACHDDMGGGMGGGMGGSGGAGSNETQRETVTVDISWDGVYRVNGAYSTGTITVPANSTVELTFTNGDSAFDHDFVVEGVEEASTAVISDGESQTITFNVDGPMETKFFCSVPGHRNNGMEGDFIVE